MVSCSAWEEHVYGKLICTSLRRARFGKIFRKGQVCSFSKVVTCCPQWQKSLERFELLGNKDTFGPRTQFFRTENQHVAIYF